MKISFRIVIFKIHSYFETHTAHLDQKHTEMNCLLCFCVRKLPQDVVHAGYSGYDAG